MRRSGARIAQVSLLGFLLLGAAAARAPAQVEASLQELLVTAVEASEGLSWQEPEAGVSIRFVPHQAGGAPAAAELAAVNKECLEVTLSAEALTRPRIALRLATPIAIPGITKTVSLWVRASEPGAIGLRVILRNGAGIELKGLVASSLTSEWRRYTLAIAPSVLTAGVVGRERGMTFVGWEVLPGSGKSGPLILYLDVVSAVTDLYDSRDPDVPEDW